MAKNTPTKSPRSKQPRGRAFSRWQGFEYSEVPADTGDKNLFCEAVEIRKLAAKFRTPLYVYSETAIVDRYAALDRAFARFPHLLCYSVKANSNLSLLKLMTKLGSGFDVVSGGELERVLHVSGRAARKVVFSGVGKTREEMDLAIRSGVLQFNVESESELELLAERATRWKKKAAIALRVNPDVPAETHPYISTGLHRHKFGVPIVQARQLYQRAASHKYLEVAGISVHIGSQITDMQPFSATMERIVELLRQLKQDGHGIRYVDAGGGLGIAYDDIGLPEFSEYATGYAQALTRPLKNTAVHLLLEPGRAIMAPAGALITSVLYRKRNNGKQFIVVDAAMNDLVRPSLYGAHHEIIPVKLPADQVIIEVVDVVGPVCETGDFFARDREIPRVEEGDLLAIMDAGAYGMALSSNYNTRPRAAEVLVKGKSARLIRRRERLTDLVRNEI